VIGSVKVLIIIVELMRLGKAPRLQKEVNMSLEQWIPILAIAIIVLWVAIGLSALRGRRRP
jgi:hypothetical protein